MNRQMGLALIIALTIAVMVAPIFSSLTFVLLLAIMLLLVFALIVTLMIALRHVSSFPVLNAPFHLPKRPPGIRDRGEKGTEVEAVVVGRVLFRTNHISVEIWSHHFFFSERGVIYW